MRGFIRKHKKLTALLVFLSVIAGFVGWDLAAPLRGGVVAGFDVMRGHYKISSFGLPMPWRPVYARLLRERYGIEDQVVAGCVVSASLVAFVEGYNAVSMRAANRKFGRDVFQESAADASREWQLRRRRE